MSPPWAAFHGAPGTSYQQSFDALVSQGYRPAEVTGYTVAGGSEQFAGIFFKDESSPAPPPGPPASGEPAKLAGITDLHNQARSAVGVPPLAWDPQLATTAQAWADQCMVGAHNPNRSSGHPYDVGENTYWRSPSASPQDAMSFWVGEKPHYDHASNSCVGGECGHYTQVVWSRTTHVGCGIATCPHEVYGTVEWMVCDYGPGGNIAGESPY
jgi:pathogenesis-related protein 1